jgi:hypothetical protein
LATTVSIKKLAIKGAAKTCHLTTSAGCRLALLEEGPLVKPPPRRAGWLLITVLGLAGLLVLVRATTPDQQLEPVVAPQVIPPAPQPTPPAPLEVSDTLSIVPTPEAIDTAGPADIDAEPPSEPTVLPALISTDDDTEIWLTQGGQRFDLGEVPEGRYEIQAIFSGDVIHAGDVSLRAGEQVKLRCDDYFQQCRREER